MLTPLFCSLSDMDFSRLFSLRLEKVNQKVKPMVVRRLQGRMTQTDPAAFVFLYSVWFCVSSQNHRVPLLLHSLVWMSLLWYWCAQYYNWEPRVDCSYLVSAGTNLKRCDYTASAAESTQRPECSCCSNVMVKHHLWPLLSWTSS